ncbi:Ent-kaurene synthase protein [Dioscorea alata]|uniref:Ent-kaurene synthase protein n=1 Tax=Dioscorea alata TaxID=55571 RepID=A0ACB7U2N5_DIOAL|nr:Ent-kaurene synthase protein [Dioscorea alata]
MMSLSLPRHHLLLPKPRLGWKPSSKVCLGFGLTAGKRASFQVKFAKRSEDRIREALATTPKVELSVSSYDTAWVAMVPSPEFPECPCFPKFVDWILENQQPDGSWGFYHLHPCLIKDALLSTLACILALKRWNAGEEHIKRGLCFIGSNFVLAIDEHLLAPVGFNIIFPGLVEYAIDMELKLPVKQSDIDAVLYLRNLELERSGHTREGKKAYLAYVAEGLGKLLDWQEIMKYQKNNGSLFNSPSTTAAAMIYSQNAKALEYLCSLEQKFGDSVPTSYPVSMHGQLCSIDNFEKFGISQHFKYEIKSILDQTYRCWVQKVEELMSNISTCALAFRLLRMNGYDVSSEYLAQYDEKSTFDNSMEGYLKDVNAVLELYKASQVKIFAEEEVLDKLKSWTSHFLREELSTYMTNDHRNVFKEVDYALKFPFYANLDRLEHKKNIEQCYIEDFQILKTAYISHGVDMKDILELALDEFQICQSIYQKEIKDLERWAKKNKLDQLKFARQKVAYCYLSAAATIFSPEASEARMSWAKNGVLTTVVDDFFDIGGSREELQSLILLVEKWDGNHEQIHCSELVNIIFSALRSTINDLGTKASALQNRNVTDHMVKIWLSLMNSMMEEAEWLRNNAVPTLDEYMENGYVSFALGPIILPALYFVGPKLSEDVVQDPEYQNLFRLVSTCGRLLNDIHSFEREGKEGKLNSVALRILHSNGSVSEEEAKRETMNLIDSTRCELLRMVLQSKSSVVPRTCKEFFWNMSRILHLFYMRTDGFSSPKEMMSAVNAVIYEPLDVSHLLSKCALEL